MSQDIINAHLASWLIEYNGYRFNPKCKSFLSVNPKLDYSGRIEIAKIFTLRVSGYITPRRPIPGDEEALGIQLPAPWPQVPAPGYDPKHVFATVDSELKIILDKLLETGKTLRYCGHGMGDLYVNTVNPNTGLFVPDLNFGPHPRIITLRPAGFNKCWFIDWELVASVPVCSDIDFNNVGNRIQEYVYSVNYNIDRAGYTKRTISGRIAIIPPMYRADAPLYRQGTFIQYGDNVNKDLEEENNSLNQIDAQIINERNQINTLTNNALTSITTLNTLLNRIGINDLDATKLYGMSANWISNYLIVNYVNPGLMNAADAVTITNSILDITDILNQITGLTTDLAKTYGLRQEFQDRVSGLQGTVNDTAKWPEFGTVFPAGPVPVDLTFGPLITDNIGNLQNYETADQYRSLLRIAFPVPFNFQRLNQDYKISEDCRHLSFSIMDQEKPSFSFIPGYSDCKINHSTETAEEGFQTWHSTLSASFKLPKFIHSFDDGVNGYGDKFGDDVRSNKIVPKKITVFLDFIKLTFQRFAVSLLTFNTTNKAIVQFPDGSTGTRILRVKSLYPTRLSISENVLDNEISFAISYFISCSIADIWYHTGHGLPCILAADMSLSAANNIALQAMNKDIMTKQNLTWAFAVMFAPYTDVLKHGDWLSSQRYASVDTRGSAQLVYDRTYNKPLNTCLNPGHAEDVLPIHLDSSSPLARMGSTTRQTITILNPSVDPNAKLKKALDELGKLPGIGGALAKAVRDAIENKTSVKAVIQDTLNDYFKQLTFDLGPAAIPIMEKLKEQVKPYIDNILQNIGAIGSMTSSLDVDLLLSDDFGIGTASDTLNLPYDIGSTGLIDLDNNSSFEQSIDNNAGFYNPVDTIAINRLFLAAVPPQPESSWIAYSSELELVTDNTIIRHKLMPKKDVSPVEDTTVESRLDTNWMETIPAGPDNVVGNAYNDFTFEGANVEDDVIQYMGSPSNIIILRGYGIRSNYEVVPPTLLKYGGLQAFQLHRRVRQKIIGKLMYKVYSCEWEIIYVLANTPTGYLATPENPLFALDNDGTDDMPISDDLGDVFVLVGD